MSTERLVMLAEARRLVMLDEAKRLVEQAKARRLVTIGTAIPESWSLAVEQAYPSVWPTYSLQIPNGWIDLAMAFSEQLSAIAPTCYVEDSKEKYGCLRFVVTGDEVLPDVWALEEIYENLSEHVCQDCGEPGQLRDDRAWFATLCDAHDLERAR